MKRNHKHRLYIRSVYVFPCDSTKCIICPVVPKSCISK